MPFDLELMQKDSGKRVWERANGVMATGLGTRMGSFLKYTSFVSKSASQRDFARRFFHLVRGDRLVTAKSSAG